MSFDALRWAFEVRHEDHIALHLLLRLANYCNETKNNEAWPSQETLEKLSAMNERTIRRKLGVLVDAGLIEVRTVRMGLKTKNFYKLTFAQADSVSAPDRTECPVQEDSVSAYTLTDTLKELPSERASRLPAGWAPPPAADAWARAAYPNMDLANELEKFTDHFLANGERKLDWTACWRNWIRRAATYHRAPVVRPGRLRGAELDARNAASLRASLDALYREGSEAAPELEPGAGQGRLARPAGGAR
jgi:hypothetical protein